MKKRFSTFIFGMLTALIISTISISALAATGAIKIEVSPISVLVNGEDFKPKDAQGNDVMVFVYNGTTYAPLRALAEAYGLEVGYDSELGIATVNDPATPKSTPTNLSEMTYTDFKQALTLRMETGTKLSAASDKGVFYHYHLTFGSNFDEAAFNTEWIAFMAKNGNEYLNALLKEYAEKAPYNTVSLHIECNNKELICVTDWDND